MSKRQLNRVARQAAALTSVMNTLNQHLLETRGLQVGFDEQFRMGVVTASGAMLFNHHNPARCIAWAFAQPPLDLEYAREQLGLKMRKEAEYWKDANELPG